MNLAQSMILGIVQGLTEFLPVSSSGHLVIASKILGLRSDIGFDILLHLATLLAVCAYFAPDIYEIIKAFFSNRTMKDPYFKLGIYVIAASIPTAIIGFSLKDIFESMFSSLPAVGMFLIITGILIMLADRFGKTRKGIERLSVVDSLIIGAAQGCAIAPGLSRSGTTVSTSLLLGLEPELAARFSFLLSIPAIIGSSIFKSKAVFTGMGHVEFAGFIAAAIFGYLAIWLFIRLIMKKQIKGFAYYCFAVGAMSIIFGCLVR